MAIKRAVAVMRQLSGDHPTVPTCVVILPPTVEKGSALEARWMELQVMGVKNKFCLQFPEFLRADWFGELTEVDDTHEHFVDANGDRIYPDGAAVPLGCTRPPGGWWCSREPGHEGPCAARETSSRQSIDPKQLAIKFHDTYEELAPQFGYETRPDTKRFDPESPNGRLMIAVCDRLLIRDLFPD